VEELLFSELMELWLLLEVLMLVQKVLRVEVEVVEVLEQHQISEGLVTVVRQAVLVMPD
jgi:hypothetical protein